MRKGWYNNCCPFKNLIFISVTFKHKIIKVDGWSIDFELGGNGPPLLLLHGFPETRFAWNKIAHQLVSSFTVILPDIPGYGRSKGPEPANNSIKYTKREMGNVLLRTMNEIGVDKVVVIGHDRGGRIAYRMALDHAAAVTKLALLNIIPTLEVIENITYERAYNLENWFFLSQPAPFPETLISANPKFYLNHIIDTWSSSPRLISKKSREEYLKYFKKQRVLKSICEEYRNNKTDGNYDQQDRDSHRRIQCPTLILWSNNDFPDTSNSPLGIWKKWAGKVSGKGLDCGHFLMEEKPREVLEHLRNFFNS